MSIIIIIIICVCLGGLKLATSIIINKDTIYVFRGGRKLATLIIIIVIISIIFIIILTILTIIIIIITTWASKLATITIVIVIIIISTQVCTRVASQSTRERARPTMLEVLLHEIEGIPAYLAESERLVADINVLKQAQATTIGAKIQNLKSVKMQDATRLKMSIAEAGWDTDSNARLSQLVDEAVAKSAMPKVMKRCVQRCMTWELYPTEQDWQILGDAAAPWSTKFDRAKNVCKKMGLMLPSETTRGRILDVLLLANHLPIERDRDFYNHLQRLNQTLHPLQAEPFTGGSHLECFPSWPKHLQTAHYEHTYADFPPACREFSELGCWTTGVRKSSQAYKRACLDVTSAIVPQNQTCFPAVQQSEAFAAMAQCLGQLSNMAMMQMPQTGSVLSATPLLPNQLALRDLPMPRPFQPAQGSPAPGSETKPAREIADDASEAPEEEGPDQPADADDLMRAALAKRTQTKAKARARQPKGKGRGGTPTGGKTTPKVKGIEKKGKGGLRKGCEATKYTKPGTFPWTIGEKRDRNGFVSLWYLRQKRLMQKLAWAAAPMKTELSRVCLLAGTVWDKHH